METLKDSALFVGSLEKAFAVLELFSESDAAVSLSQIVERTSLNKSAVQRYLFTLEALGYIQKNQQSRTLNLTPKALIIAGQFLKTDPVVNAIYPYVAQLRRDIDARVGFITESGGRAVYLLPPQSHSEVYQTDYPGYCIPYYCSAAGRMFLSEHTKDERLKWLENEEIQALTKHTITDIPSILNEIEMTKQRGYGISDREILQDNLTLSLPIRNSNKKIIGCISVITRTPLWNIKRLLEEALPKVQDITQALQVHPQLK